MTEPEEAPSVLGLFQYLDCVCEWTADPNECWTRVRMIVKGRRGEPNRVLHDETFTENPFSAQGPAGRQFYSCVDYAYRMSSRSDVHMFAGKKLADMEFTDDEIVITEELS